MTLLHQHREWKTRGHVFRHAYDLELDPERITRLVSHAEFCVAEFPHWSEAFLARAREIEAASREKKLQ